MVNCTNFILAKIEKRHRRSEESLPMRNSKISHCATNCCKESIYAEVRGGRGKLKNNQLAAASSGFSFSLTEIVVQIEIEKLMIFNEIEKRGFLGKVQLF